MKAMILAAGRGERMRPLTDHTPKPLLTVAGKPLIVYHLERLHDAGFIEVVINIAYLGDQIKNTLGKGEQWGLNISYSQEPEPLETAGALRYALSLLGDSPFLLINGDVWCDYPLEKLQNIDLKNHLAHLILVENPDHNVDGDFAVSDGLLVSKQSESSHWTFSGISVVSPELITTYPGARMKFPLGEVFRYFMQQQKISAEVYCGEWLDIGTIERLEKLEEELQKTGS